MILALVAFLLLGPKNFSQTARSLGKAVRELKEAVSLSSQQAPSSEPPLIAPDDELRYAIGAAPPEEPQARSTRSHDDLV